MSYSDITRHSGPKPRACGCKGIRTCRLCLAAIDSSSQHVLASSTTFNYCISCKKAWPMEDMSLQQSSASRHEPAQSEINFEEIDCHSSIAIKASTLLSLEKKSLCNHDSEDNSLISHDGENSLRNHGNEDKYFHSHNIEANSLHNHYNKDNSAGTNFIQEQGQFAHSSSGVSGGELFNTNCIHTSGCHGFEFDGIMILENFVTEEEEEFLNCAITRSQFVNSQSGRRKQDYGPKVNFKKQKLRASDFKGLPSYSRFIYDRMKSYPQLQNFEPVELCNLEYCQNRGAHIDPHFDDAWLWGERLVTLNLLSTSVLTFTLDSNPGLAIRVPLLRRSLIVVSSAARHTWKHSILAEDVQERRLAMTFRELSKEFCVGGSRGQEGSELLKVALTFTGCSTSS